MSNFLNKQYIVWLENYSEKNNNYSVRFIVNSLITNLKKANSIKEVQDLLQPYFLTEEENTEKERSELYGPINLHSQCAIWNHQLKNILKSCAEANEILCALHSESEVLPLRLFLQLLVNKPKLQLNTRILELTRIICDENFPDVLRFVAQLKDIPISDPVQKPPRSGDFAALAIERPELGDCVALLNKLCAKTNFDAQNSTWERANGLLQKSLLAYRDLLIEKAPLPEQHNTGKSAFCILI